MRNIWIFPSIFVSNTHLLPERIQYLTPFSGPTHKSTPLSEARSYANLAAANNYFDLLPPSPPSSSSPSPQHKPHPLSPIPLHPRVLVEERALDSYQNILFSIVHFWRSHPAALWPRRLTIVSHDFKRVRLTDEHCAALAFPLGRVRFVGINPPGLALVDGTLPQEAAAVRSWREDRHGMSPDLAAKRRRRNVYGVEQRLFLSDEERARSGVLTKLVDDGREEVLVDGGPRPWA